MAIGFCPHFAASRLLEAPRLPRGGTRGARRRVTPQACAEGGVLLGTPFVCAAGPPRGPRNVWTVSRQAAADCEKI